MANAVIRLKNVTKHYDQTCAVDDVSFSVSAGEFLVLLGGSGCGKTTTLRLVAGLERPETGEVWINGMLAAGANAWIPPEQRQIGMVFQDYALFPHLTVAQNIAFALNTWRGAARSARVDDVLALVGLEGKGARFPYQLSGGQQQRIALARALAPSPAVVLLDEPFSNLDAALRKTMREDVRAIINQTGAASIFVTHDQEEAMRLADKIAVMQSGRIIQIGKPDDLYRFPQQPALADFLGEANYVRGEAHGDHAVTPLGTVRLARPAHGTVHVLIRPEALALTPDDNGNAVVTQMRYFGYYRLLTLHHATDLTLEARVWAQDHIDVGARVRVGVEGAVVAFSLADG